MGHRVGNLLISTGIIFNPKAVFFSLWRKPTTVSSLFPVCHY